MKIVRLPDETFEFLSWLVRQDVTLPSVITDYLKWDEYPKEQIKAHFETLHSACVESREDKSDLMKKHQTSLSGSGAWIRTNLIQENLEPEYST